MNLNSKTVWPRVVFIFLATGMLGLSLTPLGFAANPDEEKPAVLHSQDITKVQESLRDKGYYHAHVDGVLGPQTREAIRQYQKEENLPVTGRRANSEWGRSRKAAISRAPAKRLERVARN
jgi:membrane-bound lytic murein transglycosylase B